MKTEKEVGQIQSQLGDKLWNAFDKGDTTIGDIYLAAPEMYAALDMLFKAPTTDQMQALEDISPGLFVTVRDALNKARGVK